MKVKEKMKILKKKINNFFDDIDELDEDKMQKLNLKPSPINANIKKTNITKKKNRFALQKKTKTDRTYNKINKNIKNNEKKQNIKEKNEKIEEEFINNEINEEDFIEPKEEKMLINKENEIHIINQINNNDEKNEDELSNDEIIVNKKESNNLGETQTNIPYIIEEQENLIASHMDIIKNEAQLLTEEGNLISKIKGITDENYTLEEYVPKIDEFIEAKVEYFRVLKQKIKEYKSLLG